MIRFPNAKINLGLQVIGKREDGYHNINTVFYPVSLYDILEIVPSSDGITGFTSSGLPIPGDPETNLCLKAFHLLADTIPDKRVITPVKIHLHKVIPMGAGLGGGSSDGANTLLILNELFGLGLLTTQLQDLARQLGSDCAFFIENKPVLARERGDRFQPVSINLKSHSVVIVVPPVHCDTATAYSGILPREPEMELTDILAWPVEQWRDVLGNDFENTIFKKYPVIKNVKEHLYGLGADYVAMSGSGAAVYGLFREIPLIQGLFPGCFIWKSTAILEPNGSSAVR